MSKNLSIKLQTIRQQSHSYCLRLWENILAGKGWTLVFLLWVGLIVALFLHFTVYARPIREVMRISYRTQYIVTFWIEHGFVKHAGLGFSEPPESNPKAMVYRSHPHANLYLLYLINLLNYWIRGVKFDPGLLVLYNQALLWIPSVGLGFLGVRVAKRLNTSPLVALICGMTGQIIYHTFPYHLERYFEPLPEQFMCLFLVSLLIVEELDVNKKHKHFLLLRGLCLFLLVYFEKGIGIPGLGAYLLLLMLSNNLQLKQFCLLLFSMGMGMGFLRMQLGLVKLKFPEISFVGATFLWRSGLDGATNYVGILTPDQMGAGMVFLRNVGAISLLILLWCFFRRDQQILKNPLILILIAIGFYVVPGYLFSQSFLIHIYLNDLFLAIASILAFCYILVPYLEQRTGNTGIIAWVLVIVGFCLSMYQLRVFAVAHPLPIPEPDWRLYRYFG